MNWWNFAQYPELARIVKEAAGLRPDSAYWAKPTFIQIVAPLIPDITKHFYRKISRLWEKGSNFHRSLIPLRDKFMNSLAQAFRCATGQAKGDPNAWGRQAAELVKTYLNVGANPYGDNLAHGRKSVLSTQQAFEKYVLPHLSKYIDFTSWWKKTTSAGTVGNSAIKNPMNNMGFAGKAPVGGEDFKNNSMEYRGMAQAWSEFSQLLRHDQSNVRALETAGKKVAAASNRLLASPVAQLSETRKRKDMFANFVSPALPELFPNNPQGINRFKASLDAKPSDSEQMKAWKRENAFLLQDAWYHPPYRLPNGQLSGQIQKLIANLKARPLVMQPIKPKNDQTAGNAAFQTVPSTSQQGNMAAAPNHLAPNLA